MGQTQSCTAQLGKKRSEGKCLLESDAIIFRGDFRLAIPLKEIRAVAAEDGKLRVTFSQGVASFELGAQAEKWADKIRNPKSLIDKLGVKPDSKVAVLGVTDEQFAAQLAERTSAAPQDSDATELDFLFFAADSPKDLKQLRRLKRRIKPNGALWVVSVKGKQASIKDVEVIAAAKQAGLVDNKVVAFSDTHTALKLVIPLALR